jgi:peptidoglycan/xylan/chitin deacetylase (PgdA/CDA1 family)
MNLLRSAAAGFAEGLTRLAGGGQRLLVLIYHRVHARPDALFPDEPDAGAFRIQMQTLREDFRVLPLGEALRLRQQGRLPARAVCVTFDDGFADNATEALPILREIGLPATFFVATGYLDGGFMFNDAIIEACRQAPGGPWQTGTEEFGAVSVGAAGDRQKLALAMIERLKYAEPGLRFERARQLLESAGARMPPGLMMTHAQLRGLDSAGMEIGGHTRTHPILARLDERTAEFEINAGREDLRGITGGAVDLFAYPNGRPGQDYTRRDVELVRKAGFHGAVTTAWGYSDGATDPWQVPRIGTWNSTPARLAARLVIARARTRGAECSGAPSPARD